MAFETTWREGPGPVVWMFCGQGAQYYQMGRELYAANARFRASMDRLDAVAAPYVGRSVVEVVYGDRPIGEAFDQLLFTHPALFMVQVALAETLAEDGPAPDFVLGASLGEFVAAAVAGVADVETMLLDIVKQARVFDEHCTDGAMLVVLDDAGRFDTDPIFAGVELAGVNFDRCFTVSGARGSILRVAHELCARDIAHRLLPVECAFHSSSIDHVEGVFGRMFASRAYGNARIPVVSCAEDPGEPRRQGFSASHWWRVIRCPSDFRRAFAVFRRRYPEAVYLDLGPSGTMAGFAKYNMPEPKRARILPIVTPFGRDIENLTTARERLRASFREGAE